MCNPKGITQQLTDKCHFQVSFTASELIIITISIYQNFPPVFIKIYSDSDLYFVLKFCSKAQTAQQNPVAAVPQASAETKNEDVKVPIVGQQNPMDNQGKLLHFITSRF